MRGFQLFTMSKLAIIIAALGLTRCGADSSGDSRAKNNDIFFEGDLGEDFIIVDESFFQEEVVQPGQDVGHLPPPPVAQLPSYSQETKQPSECANYYKENEYNVVEYRASHTLRPDLTRPYQKQFPYMTWKINNFRSCPQAIAECKRYQGRVGLIKTTHVCVIEKVDLLHKAGSVLGKLIGALVD